MTDMSRLTADKQDEKAVSRVLKRMGDLLTEGEQVEYVAIQYSGKSADAVILTDKRIIFFKPKFFGMSFEDHLWRQVEDVHVKEGLIFSTITCKTTKGDVSKIEMLPKGQARRVYAFAQQMEEKAYQGRHETDIEKLRAGAANIVVGTPLRNEVQNNSRTSSDDIMGSLKRLNELLSANLITQEDFDNKKAELLTRM